MRVVMRRYTDGLRTVHINGKRYPCLLLHDGEFFVPDVPVTSLEQRQLKITYAQWVKRWGKV